MKPHRFASPTDLDSIYNYLKTLQEQKPDPSILIVRNSPIRFEIWKHGRVSKIYELARGGREIPLMAGPKRVEGPAPPEETQEEKSS